MDLGICIFPRMGGRGGEVLRGRGRMWAWCVRARSVCVRMVRVSSSHSCASSPTPSPPSPPPPSRCGWIRSISTRKSWTAARHRFFPTSVNVECSGKNLKSAACEATVTSHSPRIASILLTSDDVKLSRRISSRRRTVGKKRTFLRPHWRTSVHARWDGWVKF